MGPHHLSLNGLVVVHTANILAELRVGKRTKAVASARKL